MRPGYPWRAATRCGKTRRAKERGGPWLDAARHGVAGIKSRLGLATRGPTWHCMPRLLQARHALARNETLHGIACRGGRRDVTWRGKDQVAAAQAPARLGEARRGMVARRGEARLGWVIDNTNALC